MKADRTTWWLVTWSEDHVLRRMVTQDKVIAKESRRRLAASGRPVSLSRLRYFKSPRSLTRDLG